MSFKESETARSSVAGPHKSHDEITNLIRDKGIMSVAGLSNRQTRSFKQTFSISIEVRETTQSFVDRVRKIITSEGIDESKIIENTKNLLVVVDIDSTKESNIKKKCNKFKPGLSYIMRRIFPDNTIWVSNICTRDRRMQKLVRNPHWMINIITEITGCYINLIDYTVIQKTSTNLALTLGSEKQVTDVLKVDNWAIKDLTFSVQICKQSTLLTELIGGTSEKNAEEPNPKRARISVQGG
jgi:hypothetical protein